MLVTYAPHDVARYVRASHTLWANHGLDPQFWRAWVASQPVNEATLAAAGHLAKRWPKLAPMLPAVVARDVEWAAPLRSGELVVIGTDGTLRVGERVIRWAEYDIWLVLRRKDVLDVFSMPSREWVQSSEMSINRAVVMGEDALVFYREAVDQLCIWRAPEWTVTAEWQAPGPLICIAASPTRVAGIQWQPNRVYVWDQQGTLLFTLEDQSVLTIAFAGGHLLTDKGVTNMVSAWHTTTGKLVRTYAIPGKKLKICGLPAPTILL
jgi:hypothetical protein